MTMKKYFLTSLVLLGLTIAPQELQAQAFLKKLTKGLEKVNKGLDNANDATLVVTGQAVQLGNGVLVMSPVSRSMDIDSVRAVGHSTSENFGDVELIIRVKAKVPVNSIALGGSWGQGKTMAFDAGGNVYKMNMPSVSDRYDVTEGLPIKITCNPFLKVRKTEKLAVVKMVAKCGDASGEITMKDVPIEWDPTDE
jgi:hypothetical protein